jgi:hypothetical protein
MVAHIRHRPVDRKVDTGVTLVTPANLADSTIKDLLSPPIGRYLGGM